MPSKLPEPPQIRVKTVREKPSDLSGFANVRRRELIAEYPDGTASGPFPYDVVERRALDAVVICAYYMEGGKPFFYLRSAVRPPLALRGEVTPRHDGLLWELPAGLVEEGESAIDAGVRETEEELGFKLDPKTVKALGYCAAPAPALIGELHHFVYAEVSPSTRGEPSLDGSPLERGGVVMTMSLEDALACVRAGDFTDEKTELGIRRLVDVLAPHL